MFKLWFCFSLHIALISQYFQLIKIKFKAPHDFWSISKALIFLIALFWWEIEIASIFNWENKGLEIDKTTNEVKTIHSYIACSMIKPCTQSSSHLAWPRISPLEQLWFRCCTFHVVILMHKTIIMHVASSLPSTACILEHAYITCSKWQHGELIMLIKAAAKMICVVRVLLTQSILALNVKYQFAISAQPLKIMKQARDESQEMRGILRTLFLREDIGV